MAEHPRSFVPVAPESHFPLQNLPFGVGRPRAGGRPRVLSAIGEQVVDLAALQASGLLSSCAALPEGVFAASSLNPFMALGRPAWRELRARLGELLSEGEPALRNEEELRGRVLRPMADFELLLPVEIGDYTDFYSSREHATNVGTMFRGAENALMPNWLHLPVAYHGRASSVVISGTDLRRPRGQVKADDAEAPRFQASRLVDFELEMGFFVGPRSELGHPVPIGEAEERIFGLVLVNDWSARDIQKWEYQPLGPFLAKNFGTSISPWVVTLDALEPFRVEGPRQDPEPLEYLRAEGSGAFDVRLEVGVQPEGEPDPTRVCVSNLRYLYWSMAQQLAHHTITGCDLRTGDLLASGTISGPGGESYGSLLELSWRGTRLLTTRGGAQRSFLQDGDRVTITGWCQGDGYRVGFGEVTGRVLPAL